MKSDELVLEEMMSKNFLPPTGPFLVTDELIHHFYLLYPMINGSSGKPKSTTNVRYAKKLAALSLNKLLKHRECEEKIVSLVNKKFDNPSGFLYIVSNPVFPDFVKIGITKDLKYRLKVYQTSDPHRRFVVEKYRFFENVRDKEREILEEFRLDISHGEWINKESLILLEKKYF